VSGPSGRGPAAFLLLLAAVPSAAGAIEPAVAFDREDLSRLQRFAVSGRYRRAWVMRERTLRVNRRTGCSISAMVESSVP
jgi:hypothetical protein